MIQAGFGKMDVTPPLGRPLGRLFRNDILAERVEWPLQVAAMAVSDGTVRLLVLSVDKNRLLDPAVFEIRQAVAAATGLPPEHQFIACTHAHNVPFATDWLPGDRSGFAYLDVLKQAACRAAEHALSTLRPARFYAARGRAAGLSVNRRPIYRTDMGEQVSTHGPTDHPDFVRNEGTADEEVFVLVAEDDGRTLGGIVNFGCHPTTMYAEPAWSADYPGAVVTALARDLGGEFLFLTGAAGNVSPHSDLLPDGEAADRARTLGETVARVARDALNGKREITGNRVTMRSKSLRILQRRPTGEQIELARRYIEEGPDVDPQGFRRRLYGYTHTMFEADVGFQEWLCREMLGMWEWQRRSALRDPADEVDIRVMTLGDFALAGFPSEIFCEFGRKVKRKSPMAATMVAELANGWHGYIPIPEAFSRGGYETCFAYQSHLVPEAGDQMCAAALALLAKAAEPVS